MGLHSFDHSTLALHRCALARGKIGDRAVILRACKKKNMNIKLLYLSIKRV